MGIKPNQWMACIVITAMVMYALCGIVKGRIQLQQAEAYRLELQRTVEALEAENEMLSAEIAAADDPAVMEQLARARLGLVRPGEIIFCASREDALERE